MKNKEPYDYLNSITCLMNLNLSLQNINKSLELKYGLSVVQWSLLKILLNMPAVSPLILAKALGVTPGTLSQTLMRLDRKKYLFMCHDPTDARKKMISITRLGKDALVSVDEEFEKLFSEVNIIDDDIQKINDYLKKKIKVRLFESEQLNTEEKNPLIIRNKLL